MQLTKIFLAGALVAGFATNASTGLRAQDDDAQGKRWYLDVKYRKLAPVTMRGIGGKQRVFWYTVLEVTNKTGAARPLDLVARALTPEDKKSPEAHPGLYPDVTALIAKKLKLPKLENVLAVSGSLEDGKSKQIVVVFPRLSNFAHFIHVRVAGLTNSVYIEGKDAWREKTELDLSFHRIGDEFDVAKNEVLDKGKSWVTVERKKIR